MNTEDRVVLFTPLDVAWQRLLGSAGAGITAWAAACTEGSKWKAVVARQRRG